MIGFNDILAMGAAGVNVGGSFLLFLTAAALPCFLWLVFYLRRDRHPEPRREIAAVFFLGALMAMPAVWLEVFLINKVNAAGLPEFWAIIISNIVCVAFIEELAKYLAVWSKEQLVNKSRELDEAIDFVIYMAVAALGFATLENFLVMASVVQEQLATYNSLLGAESASSLISVSIFRAISAILLHTLCSGILGFYMAKSFYQKSIWSKFRFLAGGFIIVSVLHGLYDFSIMKSEQETVFLFLTITIIASLALVLSTQFKKLLKMKSEARN